jgi:hypothetical protein
VAKTGLESSTYGKTVNAFKIVEGWHLRYLLCLFAAGVLCSICVVAIVTAMNQSFESGLTAGSYALALAGGEAWRGAKHAFNNIEMRRREPPSKLE